MKKWYVLCGLVLLIDRLSKAWAREWLLPVSSLPLLPGVARFTFGRNTGAAFSIGAGSGWAIPLLSALLILLALILHLRRGFPALARGGFLLIAAGGMSNLMDRLLYGYVVDFIELEFMSFALFNLADVAVCTGAGLAFIGILRKGQREDAVDR
ncbi:MAG: signal peptidase II [Clostridiales bacterium]|nr:signal peptidase II [Bacillota bacterium]NLL55227.1 signal peptidase II [Clostridiales bacterium]